MDYPAPSPQAATPWRRATLIASALAAVELAVIVVAGVAIFGKTVAKHVERIHRKLGVDNRAAAAARAHDVAATPIRLSE